MSLDIDLMVMQPVSVYTDNITHNLGKMANAVVIIENDPERDNLSLYDVLWRPDENGFKYAKDIAHLLGEGWKILYDNPEKFRAMNPENGWGSYELLCEFVYQYSNACWDNPDAELRVSR